MQTIYLDVSNRGVIPVIYAKQNDVGRKVEVVLTNSGLPYEPEAGSAFSAWFSGAGGMGNYTDIGEKSAFSVSNNKVTVELIAQMLQNAGEGFLCLVLSRANGEQIGLWNIRYVCEGIPGAGSDPAKDYYTAFSQAVAGLAYPDASLSAAGKAADAAATGRALKGKAPAGYGLGDINGMFCTDANTATNIGFYWLGGEGTLNVPFYFAWGTLLVERRQTHIYQTAKSADGYPSQQIVTRYSTNSGATWSEWEWVNPPMLPGVEYRTTERWEGKAVYSQYFDFGYLPNNTFKSVPLPVSTKVSHLVDYYGHMRYSTESSEISMTYAAIRFQLGYDGIVRIDASENLSTFAAKFVVKYTKD